MSNSHANEKKPVSDEIGELRARLAEFEKLQARREQAEKELATIARLGTRLAAADSTKTVMQIFWEETDVLLSWDYGYLAHRQADGHNYRVVFYVDTEDSRKKTFPGEELARGDFSSTVQRVLDGESVLINRSPDDPRPVMIPAGTMRPCASLLFVPVRSGEVVAGFLSVQSYRPARYGQADLETLRRVADVVAPALERVLAEEALRQSEARYRSLVERIPATTYTAAADGADTTSYASPQMASLLGYSPAECQADPEIWRKRLHPDDRDRVLAAATRSFAVGEPFVCEYRVLTRDGRVIWLHDEGAVVADAAGRTACLQGVVYDITERKRAEDLLRLQRDLGIALAAAITLTDAMTHILAAALRIDGIDCGGVYLIDEDTGDLDLIAHQGLSQRFVNDASHFAGDTAQACVARTPRAVYGPPGALIPGDPCGPEGLRFLGVVPVRHDGRLIAVLNVATRARDEIAGHVREAVEAIASQIGGAIVRIRLRDALQAAHATLEKRVDERTAQLHAANTKLRSEVIERTRAEDALRASEERYRTLIETTDTGFVVVDGMGRVLDANAEYVRLTGHQALPEIQGKSVLEWTAKHDLARNAEAVRACLEKGFIRNLEIDYVNSEGRITPIEVHATVLAAAEGPRIVSVCRDITDRRKTEQALRDNETRFRMLAENALLGVYLFDRHHLLYVNPAFARVFGYEPDAIVGRLHPLALVHPDDRSMANEQMRRRFDRESDVVRYRFRGVREDGSVVYCEALGRYIEIEGEPAILGTLLDVTDGRLAELQRERLVQAIENAGEGIGIWDLDWRLAYGNAALHGIFGWPQSQKVSGSLWPLLQDDGASDRQEDVVAAIARDGRWQGKLVAKRTAGGTVPVAATFARFVPAYGEPMIVGSIRDVTAEESYVGQIRKLSATAEATLEAERARISRELHDELGQLLTAFNLDLAWVRHRLARGEASVRERIEEMTDIARRMTDGVRDLSKRLRPSLLDHEGLVAAVRSHVSEFGRRTGIACRVVVKPADLDVDGPLATTVFRIVQEALTNVARHSRASRCRVSLCLREGGLSVEILDNGVGADAEALNGGRSLGIIGMRERAVAVGGTLRIENRSPAGLRIAVRLPLPQEG